MKSLDFIVSDSESNVRLDICVSRRFSCFSRTFVARFIESGHVLVNKKLANKKYITKPGDYVVFSFSRIYEKLIKDSFKNLSKSLLVLIFFTRNSFLI